MAEPVNLIPRASKLAFALLLLGRAITCLGE
jgi:hypothetical protein